MRRSAEHHFVQAPFELAPLELQAAALVLIAPASWSVTTGLKHARSRGQRVAMLLRERLDSVCGNGIFAGLASCLHFQEVANHLVAALSQDALGVELNALDGQCAVAQTHDD
jgi:hypothetical protein